MNFTRNSFSKWVLIFILPLIILLSSQSPVHGQWTSVAPPVGSGDWMLYAVHFTSDTEGWAVGYDSSVPNVTTGVLLHYQNEAWEVVTPPTVVTANWCLYGVHFPSANEGWAVGWGSIDPNATGALLHYQNGAWEVVTPPTVSDYWNLYAVHFTSATEGWAVGLDDVNGTGVLLHYEGDSWTAATPPALAFAWSLNGVHLTSATEGWAVGRDYVNFKGFLLHYQNGNWSSVAPPNVGTDWYLTGVHFTSATEGWAVGYDKANTRGVLLRYQNGNWTSVSPPTVGGSWDLYAVHFTSANEGWAVGNSWDSQNGTGALLHYRNGTWTSVTPPTISEAWGLEGVHFTSSGKGWAVGSDSINHKVVLLQYSGPILSTAEGTIGTQLTITDSGFGTKKGKVLIGSVATKVTTWTDTSITCLVTKVPPAGGPYDVTITPKKAASINISGAFTVMPPQIDSLDSYHGAPGTPITISGNFFSTKKGKVYLEYSSNGQIKKVKCKITSWGMNNIVFVVPKTSKSFPSGTYPLKVMNTVEATYAPSDFTID